MSFKKGDVVIYRGEEYKVIILGKDFLLQNVKNGEKVHLKYKDMTQVKKKQEKIFWKKILLRSHLKFRLTRMLEN